jgi:UTP--glucose-1-phosphate uridylyltransferase
MNQLNPQFAPFAARMQAENLPSIFIDTFAYYYDKLVTGYTGLIPEVDIVPVSTVPNMETFPDQLRDAGREALAQTVVIKLNGGLGTSMGLEKAKSLLLVKNGYSFLDVISRQAIRAGVPLMLMNSFTTEDDSLVVLEQHSELLSDLPLSFVQHKEPKIICSDLSPAVWPKKPALEWCPPGHGDIYTALVTRGALDAMLNAGYKYAFVSNADNLGAILDMILVGYFAQNDFPFMMEVADRTEMDKKGGHLARRQIDGQFILRELAQCPEDDLDAFQDIQRHRYFNTNNLWINLEALQQIMIRRNNRLKLPMMRNQKTIDPRDSSSTPVFQLETAMGSAVGVFSGAQAVRVPRARFAPVKKTDDLLAVRSDAYVLSEDFEVLPHPKRRSEPPVVELDPQFYKFVSDLDARLPKGAPSLLNCERLHVIGDFLFEEGVICRGSVELRNDTEGQIIVPAGTILEG